ncbi:MAG TPA: protein containing glycosyl transferase group 1 domain protein, partial [Casimicrobium sp.]|nr:protein containing glycosyl transferase group 1 domain protein [Casimicrobium sp.]
MFTVALGYGGAESDFLRLATYFSQRAEVTVALMARDYGGSSYSLERAPTDLKIVVLDDGSERADGGVTAKARRWWRMYRRLRDLKAQHDVTISFLSGPNLLNAFAGPRGTAIVSERGSKR